MNHSFELIFSHKPFSFTAIKGGSLLLFAVLGYTFYSREEADYYHNYSKDTAQQNVEVAGEFIDKCKVLIDKKVIIKF